LYITMFCTCIKNHHMKSVIAYCRTSTEGQKDKETIDLQVQSLGQYADKNGLEIREWFKDDGVSGGLEKRPELMRLLDYLKENPAVESVLIYKLDRLARDLYIQEGLIRKFAELNKQVLSTLEPDLDGNDPGRRAFRQMLGVFAEFEKAMIALRMKTGKYAAVSKGRWHGGYVYGYNNDGSGRLVVNEQESEVVRKIFHMKSRQRQTYLQVAEHLNAENVKTKFGRKWHASTVRAILKNPVHKGKIRFGDKTYDGLHAATL
jgi:site-specific DNA recombinase